MSAWSINRTVRTPLLLLGLLEFSAMFAAVYLAGILVFGNLSECEINVGTLLPKAALLSVVMIVSLIATGLYNFHQRAFFREIIVRVSVAFAGGAVVLSAIFYVVPFVRIPMNMGLITVVASGLAVLIIRYFFLSSVDENVFRHRTFIYGNGSRAATVSELRRRADRRGFRIVGVAKAPGDAPGFDDNKIIEGGTSLLSMVQESRADEIVIAMDDRRGNLPIRELLDCKLQGINVIDLVDFMERETGKVRVDLVNPGWIIFSQGFLVSRTQFACKKVIDILVSSIGVVLAWPLMLLVALAIKIEDGISSPVLYRQERVGQFGVTFDVLKFRSMAVDAEADGKAVWAEESDSRITRTGRFIRKYRLDELPQIVNVLKGEMSLVGPRPERPQFVTDLEKKVPYYSERHTVKPGVTGWAQLKYAYGSSEEDAVQKLQYDLYYVKNQNFLLDLIIILQTVEVVLWGKGAR